MIKEHDQQAKTKATPKRLAYADSDKEAPTRSLARDFFDRLSLESSSTSDTHRQTRSASKSHRNPSTNKEPSHLRRSKRLEDRSTTKKKEIREKSKSIGKRSRYQETSSDSEHEDGSEDTYEDLNPLHSPKELLASDTIEGLSSLGTSRYAKDPTMIHGIKRRQNKGLQTFMDRFKSESSHIKGVPPVLRISAFMHGHGHPELAKKLNDKIPKTVDEMFERVRAFVRGEVVAGSTVWSGIQERARNRNGPRDTRRSMGMYTPYPKRDTFTPLTKTLKEILAMESISFPKPPPLIGTPESKNLNKFCDYHGDRSHNTNDCYQLKKQIEDVVASGKLTHLVKDIRRNNQRNGGQGRSNIKVINMIRGGRSRKRPFEGERSGLTKELTFPAIYQGHSTDGPIILEGMIEGRQVRRIHVDGRSSSEIMYEHYFRNFNVGIRSRLRKCKAPLVGFLGKTYHPLGIVDLWVTMGEAGNNKTMPMEFAIVKYRSSYNVIIRRTRMRSLGVVGSTIHSMIKFPITQRIVTIETSREALWICRQLDRMQNTLKETQWRQQEEQMS
ncbi:hypothetical protein Tco_0610288 [Tanacetum coccineum]